VIVYLSREGNEKLKEKLLQECDPNTSIVAVGVRDLVFSSNLIDLFLSFLFEDGSLTKSIHSNSRHTMEAIAASQRFIIISVIKLGMKLDEEDVLLLCLSLSLLSVLIFSRLLFPQSLFVSSDLVSSLSCALYALLSSNELATLLPYYFFFFVLFSTGCQSIVARGTSTPSSA
jgi:hypothetical protein